MFVALTMYPFAVEVSAERSQVNVLVLTSKVHIPVGHVLATPSGFCAVEHDPMVGAARLTAGITTAISTKR
jgi:hypothetical protein